MQRKWWWERDWHLGRLQTLQPELRLGLLDMLLNCERRERRKKKQLSMFVFSKHQCLHHHQCSNCHKISVQDLTLFYTTTKAAPAPPPHGEEERDRLKRRRSLLRLPVRVHPQFHFTHQQYNCTSSSRSASDRNRGGTQRSRQLHVSLLLFLSVYCTSSQSKCVFFSPKNLDLSDLFAPKSKDWDTNLCKMPCLLINCGFYVIKIHGLDDAFDHSINDGSFWMNVVMPPRMMGHFG
jgi:hypothetical protein